ncbi:MAG: 23S rRNA (guanosine(2251)-2'-O)-methyltransferase RlmB [Bacteroidetes bacterium]|nr:MAG: 23S rRNA (guanosine(2251)-2'-O)-methyltransferase RlmB [Bacteroidota bacterium]
MNKIRIMGEEKKQEVLYGMHSVMEALLQGKELDKVFIRKSLQNERSRELVKLLRDYDIPFQFVPQEKLQRITSKNHQGVIALGSLIEYGNLDATIPGLFEQGEVPFILILDGITDVRNLGAIARTAECVGVNALLLPMKGSAQINADAIKTSSGALLNLNVCRTEKLSDAVQYLKNSGLKIISATEKASQTYFSADLNGPVALIIGSEERGISTELIALSDIHVKIPVLGKVNSLNASVAGAVMMYEILRQRIH